MSIVKDYKPFLDKHSITFVEKKEEVGNIVSFIFEPENSISWKAGQHGVFFFSKKMDGGNWRAFSIAESPEQNQMRISTRIVDNPSNFKKGLLSLHAGDKLTMRGPFGPFYLSGKREPVIFIAGGIGITPYRSLIKHAAISNDDLPSNIHLLYVDNSKLYAFKNELDEIEKQHPTINLHYLISEELAGNIEELINKYGNDATYYISGPKQMVESIKKSLVEQGISKKSIRNELFIGL